MVATPQDDLYHGVFTTTALIVAIFIALSLANAVEILLLVLFSFKKWRGVYFQSLVIAASSILVYSVGFTLYYYALCPRLAGSIINNIGWIAMVCSQSVVLYSRLHLVLDSPRILKGILWTIIINGAVFYVLATTMQFGSYATRLPAFTTASYIVEKVQMTAFSLQELVISGIYVRRIFHFFKATFNPNKRRTIWHLLAVQAIIIALDLALLMLEYLDFLVYQQAFKSTSYSLKLKMEFAVLGDLIESVRATASLEPAYKRMDNVGNATHEAPKESVIVRTERNGSSEST